MCFVRIAFSPKPLSSTPNAAEDKDKANGSLLDFMCCECGRVHLEVIVWNRQREDESTAETAKNYAAMLLGCIIHNYFVFTRYSYQCRTCCLME